MHKSGLTLLLFGASLTAPLLSQKGDSIQRLRWLAGCWEQSGEATRIVEQWTDARGGLMLGTSRTFKAGHVVTYEFMAIRPDSMGVVLEAHPSGQEPSEFKSISVTENEVVFTNPKHDFPTEIRYARVGADSVIASISGSSNGTERKILFPYRRAVCDNAAGDRR